MHRFLRQLDEAWKIGYEFVNRNPILLKRTDINSVMPSSGKIMNDRRIREALATTVELRKAGALAITDGAHQSRKGKADFYPTLEHSRVMNQILQEDYSGDYKTWEYIFNETCWGPSQAEFLVKGKNILSNNIRFAPWELETPSNLNNLPPIRLVEKLQKAGQLIGYVQDAFASAHRGGKKKDTSMLALPTLLKQKGVPVFPSRAFVNEMRKFAQINEKIGQSQKVVVALFGGKVKDYIDILSLYKRYDHTEFLAGSLLSMVFLKSQNPSLSFGVNDERFFKDIGQKELAQFKQHFDPTRVHLAKDLILTTPDDRITTSLESKVKIQHDVQGIGTETVGHFIDVVKGAQLLIVNGCPCNINQFDIFGGPFTEFMTQVRKQNGTLTVYDCGGDAITAIKFTKVKTDISSTAGKLGLLAPMIETKEDLEHFTPSILPLIDVD